MNIRLLTTIFATLIVCVTLHAQRTERELLSAAGSVLRCDQPSAQLRKVMETDEMAAYSRASGGFAVVSKLTASPAILAYSPDGTMRADDNNPGFQWWLSAARRALRQRAAAPTTPPDTSRFAPAVEPLLTSIWGQREPFNFMCPFSTFVGDSVLYGSYQPDSSHFVAGCGPVAMAQLMRYYEFPATGTGSASVTVKYTKAGQDDPTLATYSVDFGQTNYDWDQMIDDYQGDYTPEQGRAVAQLCYHCGVAAQATYNHLGAGTTDATCLEAFQQHFGYSDSARLVARPAYSEPQWMEMVYDQLTRRQPIYYSARDLNLELGIIAGHNFIIDGYDETGMVHVNWGWYGFENGYFNIALLNPQQYTYDDWQGMFLNLVPGRAEIVGDVTDDGLTDIDDVNAIVNLILAGGGSGNARADLDHNGAVDVDDLNALINILLEK